MATASDGIHSSVQAIQDMEAACARFARAVVERLPEVERELRQVAEGLEDRRCDLRREISSLESQISSADEDDDVSSERHRVAEAEDELASVGRRIRRLGETSANYTKQARAMEHLATAHAIQAREFLTGAAEDLKAYLAKTDDGFQADGIAAKPVPATQTIPAGASEALKLPPAKDSGGLNQSANSSENETFYAARFGYTNSTAYRSTFLAAYPYLKDLVVVHHAVPQEVLKRYSGLVTKMEIHSLENLRGIPKTIDNDFHQSLIKSEWNRFFRENQITTKECLLEKATEIDAKYGHNFLPPIT